MSWAAASSSTPDVATLGRGPWGTFAYGRSRPVVLRALYGLAMANDADPFWLDLRGEDTAPDPDGPTGLGWIWEPHLFAVSGLDARPRDAIGNLARWTVIRSDEPDAAVAQLTDFLRLPPAVQEAVSGSVRAGAAPVFVVANSDRVRTYRPATADGVRPIVETLVRAGVVPIFGAISSPGPGRMAFDFVFDVRAASIGQGREGTLWVEKAPPESSLPVGASIPLVPLPSVVRAFERNGPSRALA